MTINVYAWPPVPVTGAEWTEHAPTQASRSLVTGADYVSAVQRKRRLATLQVGALGHGGSMGGAYANSGAGYMEVLKKLLAGVHAVRLYSPPINWHMAALARGLTRYTSLATPPETRTALGASGVITSLGETDGWPNVHIEGFPPNMLVASPGDFVRVQEDEEDVGAVAQIIKPARTDGSGEGNLKLLTALPYTGIATLNATETAVFRPVGEYPRAVQPAAGQWTYDWSFREVFEDEVGGFVEINPWL